MRRFLVFGLVLSWSCSDYELGVKDDGSGGSSADPDIEVTPLAFDELVCGTAERVVTLSNVGAGPLEIASIALDATGWTGEESVDVTLEPGTQMEVPLVAAEGSGVLEISSNDPDEPVVRVSLSAASDAAPVAEVVSPLDGTLLQEGEMLLLEGEVSDAEDPALDLRIEWSSDVDGILSTTPPDTDGWTGLEWSDADRTAGDHRVSLSVVDLCGNETVSQVAICQQSYTSFDELDIDAWHFEGHANWDGANGWVELTTVDPYQVGTAFATDETVDGGQVEIRFNFYIGDGTGADGLSLTALDTTRHADVFLGGTGCGLGYGGDAPCTDGPALPGWSIEVDTFFNDGQDPTEADHVMFTFDGDVDDPAIWAELPAMEDTGWHTMEVWVNSPHVEVAIDGVTYLNADLDGHFDFPAYVGFTAGTGGYTNTHLIDSLVVNDAACPE